MAFRRLCLYNKGLEQQSRAGDITGGNLVKASITADSNSTITASQLSGGLVIRSGQTASRTDTTDTAVNILAANSEMDVGDSFGVHFSNTAAQAQVLAGGTGVTAAGNLTIAATSSRVGIFTKTSATTMDLQVL